MGFTIYDLRLTRKQTRLDKNAFSEWSAAVSAADQPQRARQSDVVENFPASIPEFPLRLIPRRAGHSRAPVLAPPGNPSSGPAFPGRLFPNQRPPCGWRWSSSFSLSSRTLKRELQRHFRACRFRFASYFIHMSTVLEIESAIEQLPPKEKWNLIYRLHDALWQDWDKQIEADAAAGRLDHLVKEVEADIAAGRVKPLDEIIDHP
jgi:AraC-like DNA-binding protein